MEGGDGKAVTIGNPLAGFTRAMRHGGYRRYTIASLCSNIGTWTHRVAMGWLVWELTGSYAWLGIVAFTDLFAGMLVAPIAGELADRMDRIKLSLWAQWAQLAQALAMAAMVFGGWIDRWSRPRRWGCGVPSAWALACASIKGAKSVPAVANRYSTPRSARISK